ncbi:MAG: hypothetical protein ACPG6R_11935 [Aequoribacter sp.]|uniref:hypothetical protein n=1 Tax=Aequoribacter sp. TaxID=2847771 RepID=UPI003C48AE10
MFKSKKRKQREAEEAFVNYNPLRDAKERAFWNVVNRAKAKKRYESRHKTGIPVALAALGLGLYDPTITVVLLVGVLVYYQVVKAGFESSRPE